MPDHIGLKSGARNIRRSSVLAPGDHKKGSVQ
jgi:hypothetical protein